MERALHDPRRGYYARRIQGIGSGGDFTTTPMISPVLARALAARIVATGLRDLIELGPGEGKLAAEILRALPWWRRWRIRLHLVESSVPLREKQRARLGKKARWHETVAEALTTCDGHAFLYSNELIDAFPVRRFRREAEGWSELYLLPGPREQWLPVEDLPPSTQFTRPHPIGQIIEIHDSVRQWLADWLPGWRKGEMVTIDYGAEADTLYHRRPHGTLRGYLLQQRMEGASIYENIGRQDLTADVDFTDLSQWSEQWISRATYISAREFLLPYIDTGSRADAALIDPQGAGEAFRVLTFVK